MSPADLKNDALADLIGISGVSMHFFANPFELRCSFSPVLSPTCLGSLRQKVFAISSEIVIEQNSSAHKT